MKVLVTGGGGYIGSHTIKKLLERGHEPTAFDNLASGHIAAVPDCPLIHQDLSSTPDIFAAFEKSEAEAVMHFAAHCSVGESVQEPAMYYQNNVVNTLRLLRVMLESDVKKIIFSSTAAVYGIPEKVPIPENHPCNPINPYGQTKLIVENILADYSSAYGLSYASLRYFNAAGAALDGSLGEDHSPETHLVPIIMQAALGKRDGIDIFGTDYETEDGTCVRDYIHVDDLATTHVLALETLEKRTEMTLNLGTGHGYSVKQVIETARQVTGKKILAREVGRRAGDPPVLVAALENAPSWLGWTPEHSDLETIIQTAWDWHSKHPDGYQD